MTFLCFNYVHAVIKSVFSNLNIFTEKSESHNDKHTIKTHIPLKNIFLYREKINRFPI